MSKYDRCNVRISVRLSMSPVSPLSTAKRNRNTTIMTRSIDGRVIVDNCTSAGLGRFSYKNIDPGWIFPTENRELVWEVSEGLSEEANSIFKNQFRNSDKIRLCRWKKLLAIDTFKLLMVSPWFFRRATIVPDRGVRGAKPAFDPLQATCLAGLQQCYGRFLL